MTQKPKSGPRATLPRVSSPPACFFLSTITFYRGKPSEAFLSADLSSEVLTKEDACYMLHATCYMLLALPQYYHHIRARWLFPSRQIPNRGSIKLLFQTRSLFIRQIYHNRFAVIAPTGIAHTLHYKILYTLKSFRGLAGKARNPGPVSYIYSNRPLYSPGFGSRHGAARARVDDYICRGIINDFQRMELD